MSRRDPFFVGYLPCPKGLRLFWASAIVSLLVVTGGLSFAIAVSQDDPGDAAFRFDLGRQTVTGVVALTPTPVLLVTQGNESIPAGHTLLLSGQGKNGTARRAVPLAGQLAVASGVLLDRGDLSMLQLRGGQNGLAAADGTVPDLPPAEDLGRWRLAGEICDGKCLAGAMRPGRGLSHKACATLCIAGGIPPVFVSTQPIEGSEYLLIAGVDGDALPPSLYDYVGAYVALEGQLSRLGDLLILTVDAESVELLP